MLVHFKWDMSGGWGDLLILHRLFIFFFLFSFQLKTGNFLVHNVVDTCQALFPWTELTIFQPGAICGDFSLYSCTPFCNFQVKWLYLTNTKWALFFCTFNCFKQFTLLYLHVYHISYLNVQRDMNDGFESKIC